MRYIIASLIPPQLELNIRQAYQTAFQKACRVRTLHLTFIPPFIINSSDTLSKIQEAINQLPETDSLFSFDPPGIFNLRDTRQVLYLPLKPIKPHQSTHHTLTQSLSSLISIETKSYKAGKIPEFLPHITLDYHFNQPNLNSLVPPTDPFRLETPKLLVEQAPGIWQPISPL